MLSTIDTAFAINTLDVLFDSHLSTCLGTNRYLTYPGVHDYTEGRATGATALARNIGAIPFEAGELLREIAIAWSDYAADRKIKEKAA